MNKQQEIDIVEVFMESELFTYNEQLRKNNPISMLIAIKSLRIAIYCELQLIKIKHCG